MVSFDEDLTEMVFFDLEFYVPEKDRKTNGASLLANPTKTKQFLLGGVFCRYWPLKKKQDELEFKHIWIWDLKTEKKVLKSIYEYFQSSWDMIKNKDPRQADLILCGIGITRFDLPVLYIRSVAQKIDSKENIFNIYYKTKPVDFSTVTIPFFNREKVMYPKTANQILNRFRLEKEKSSSILVWEKYDNNEYDWIRQRTEEEVKASLNVYNIICDRICSQKEHKTQKTQKNQKSQIRDKSRNREEYIRKR
jgi:hypothetical protein